MSKETYDQSTVQLVPLVKQQPGFILHAAYPSGGGYTIVEVWESEQAANNWYNNVVRPASQQANIPDFQPEFQELSNVATP
ncbi:MAG: antibiotic biosynthesis monooxygenase [Chloroflexi bacterium]|nr:antibiotic biosynthesis monooxygenase [Chloroflexota bacterium]